MLQSHPIRLWATTRPLRIPRLPASSLSHPFLVLGPYLFSDTVHAAKSADASPPPGVPLPTEGSAFWGKDGGVADTFGEVRVPSIPAALVRRLGNFPFWRGDEPFLPAMERIYREASVAGLDVFLGERGAGKDQSA